MRKITAIVLFAAASTLSLGNAFAQANALRVTMPFDFTIGSKLLPAGTYNVIQVRDNLIEIRGVNKTISLLSSSYSDDTQPKNGAVLVFDKIGGDYFLRQVLGGSAGAVNVSLPLSASEERVRKQESHAKNINQISIQGTAGD